MNYQYPTWTPGRSHWLVSMLFLALLTLVGCSEDGPLSITDQQSDIVLPDTPDDHFLDDAFERAEDKSIEIITQNGSIQPTELVTVDFLDQSLTFYPYVATQLDEVAVDPINLVFVGEVDPVQIRSALLALDGDRTAYGFPSAYPFDQVWTDALGGSVGTTWVEEEGWVGSVIQLTIGNYETLRFHLRLYRTGTDGWTLGSAEFEVMIPGTADHQVLHWEIAEQIVMADLVRSGLLDADVPMMSTGLINQPGGFGEIPVEIYNMLPPELTELIGTPPPVDNPVPIPTDGEATILNLAQSAPLVSGEFTNSITIDYDQYVPRPFCSSRPYDWLYVTGPVTFDLWVRVDQNGNYRYRSSYGGTLDAVPIDMEIGEPCGEMFPARVGDRQHGFLNQHDAFLSSRIMRMTSESDGPQILFEDLMVHENGPKRYRSFTRCLDAVSLSAF